MQIPSSLSHHLLGIFTVGVRRMMDDPPLCIRLHPESPILWLRGRFIIFTQCNTTLIERDAFGGIINDGQGERQRQDCRTRKDAEDLARDGFLAEAL
jgi:hypothetical protein